VISAASSSSEKACPNSTNQRGGAERVLIKMAGAARKHLRAGRDDHVGLGWPGRTVARTSPQGPPEGEARVIRGGSYLCHTSHCNRHRVASGNSNTPDSTTGHMEFRCVAA
jgi:hypothetical protein